MAAIRQPRTLYRRPKYHAAKYGSLEYAGTVIGLELVNEPISWANNTFSTTQSWAADASAAAKASATNPNLTFIMHDAFEGPLTWASVAQSLSPTRQFAIDTHLYQLFTDSDNALTQAQHIAEACSRASSLAAANAAMPTFVGEWSAATNICVNPDGSTTAGTSCSAPGCQCQSAGFSTWNDALKEQARRFMEAQLDVFESGGSGYVMWAAKGPGGWGF
jgi:glucan 1,3-beta-glucosidase